MEHWRNWFKNYQLLLDFIRFAETFPTEKNVYSMVAYSMYVCDYIKEIFVECYSAADSKNLVDLSLAAKKYSTFVKKYRPGSRYLPVPETDLEIVTFFVLDRFQNYLVDYSKKVLEEVVVKLYSRR